MDHSHDRPPASEDFPQGPWSWLPASSHPESSTTLIPSTGEADAWILRDEPLAGPIVVPEYPLPDMNSLSLDDILAFQAADGLVQQTHLSPSTWLPPTAAELELAVGPDPFQGLDPLAWALLVQGIGPIPLFDGSFTPHLNVGGGQLHDQSPMTNSPAVGPLDVSLFNPTKPTILPKPSPSTSASASPSTSSLSPSSSSAPPPRGTVAAYTCPSCTAPFTGARALRAHRLRHTRPFACPVCTRGHASRKDMYRHAWAHHAAEAARLDLPVQTRRCPVCNVEERADNLVRHLRKKHGRGQKW